MPKVGELLQRILDVIQEDFTDTSFGDRRQFLIKASKEAGISVMFGIDQNGEVVPKQEDPYRELQDIKSDPAVFVGENNPTWLSLLQIQEQMLEILTVISTITPQGGGYIHYQQKSGLFWNKEVGNFSEFKQISGKIDDISVTVENFEEKINATLRVRHETTYLIDALKDVPINDLKKCPECNKYFVQLTQRMKKFCSTKCRNRFNIRAKYKPKK